MSARLSAATERESGPLAAWGRFAARHWGRVLVGWVALVVLLGVLGVTARGRFADDFRLPGAESQAALDLLQHQFPQQAGDPATVVLSAESGFEDPAVRVQVDELLDGLRALPEVVAVASPFEPGGGAVSRDGTIAYATVQYGRRGIEVADSSVSALFELVDGASAPGLQVEVGGPVVQSGEILPPGRSEAIGLAAGAVILLVAFGSAVAMGLPMVTALFGLGTGIVLILLLARTLGMSTFTPAFAAMIGIGVGIDYALLVVTRYREELARGLPVVEAVAVAVDTAGRAVIFAGAAVAIALLALFVVGIEFVAAIGVAGATVVFSAVLVATTLLPALLGMVGPRIDRWRIPVFHANGDSHTTSVWHRFSGFVQRNAILSAVVATGALLLLAAPALDMRLGSSDAGNNPESLHSRRAYDLLSEGFGPGFNGPFIVAVELPSAASEPALGHLRDALAATDGVVFVSPRSSVPKVELRSSRWFLRARLRMSRRRSC